MTWTTGQEIRAHLNKLWERGEILREFSAEQSLFPLRIPLKTPVAAEITDQFDLVRAWVASLVAINNLRVEWQEVRHRVHGLQRMPCCCWIDTIDDALKVLGKQREWGQFTELAGITEKFNPVLLAWLLKRPLQALELASEWGRLLEVTAWMQQNPKPNIYLRQVNIPGVHSKFIELHRSVLAELFDLVLPADCIEIHKTGVSYFARRYGFIDKPVRIRFRILDPNIYTLPGVSSPDIALDADNFCKLSLQTIKRVFITENEINFLSLPLIPESIAIFGSGYGWDSLAKAHWLEKSTIYYWGDIDTHGFAILDQLRAHFKLVISMFMDRETLESHKDLWGAEGKPVVTDLHRLTQEESALYNDLRDNRLGQQLRFEQEHVNFKLVEEKFHTLVSL